MRVLLLDKEKITRITLPKEIDGVFVVPYKANDTNITKELTIEANKDNWLLKGNNTLNIIQNEQVVNEATLRDYLHLRIKVVGKDDILDLYCLPTVERNYFKIAIDKDKEEITIGSSDSCSIIYNDPEIKPVHAGIYKQDNDWYIGTPEEVEDANFYINNKFINNARSKIEIGDVIFTKGLKFIWMGTFIKISNPLNKIKLNPDELKEFNEDEFDNTKYDPVSEEQQDIELYKKEDYFFHTPSIENSIKEKEITIENPPLIEDKTTNKELISFCISFTFMAAAFVSSISVISNINSTSNVIGVSISLSLCALLAIFGLVSPKLVTKYLNKKTTQKDNNTIKNYINYLDIKTKEMTEEIEHQADLIKEENVSLNDCLSFLNQGKSMIWSREIKDDTFLNIRTGIGNIKAKIKLNLPKIDFNNNNPDIITKLNEIENFPRILNNVPVPFNLIKNRVSAIVSDTYYANYFLDSVILQLITLQSAQELKIVFFLNDENEFTYGKYLPHTFNHNKTTRYYAKTYDEMKTISSELETIFNERQLNTSTNNYEINEESSSYKKFDTYYLIITNDILNTKNIPIVDLTLNSIENLGFSLLMIEKNMNNIPKRCNSFISLSENSGCVMEKDLNSQIMFKPEFFEDYDMTPICEKLLNIPLQINSNESKLPDSLTFLEMYNVSKIEQLNISNRWKNTDSTMSLSVPIGIHSNNELFTLDLHENAYGPNALIAGAPGSGKTEFITNYILSLAINYNPDDVSFILIDQNNHITPSFETEDNEYKIPHILGTIKSLDENEIYKAIKSLEIEIQRREKLFTEVSSITGENNIDIYKYQKYYKDKLIETPIPHLFIITDEFIDFETQEFMGKLLEIISNGKKYGFHLILSTNKPEGIINEDIWSNITTKICFKVQTPEESISIIKRPDAAKLKIAGRFYLQVGFDEQIELGQSSWPGANYSPSDHLIHKKDDSISFINNIGKTTKNVNDFIKQEISNNKSNQLTNTIDYINNLTIKEQYHNRKIILSPLSKNIYIANLSKKYNYTQNSKEILIGEYADIEKSKYNLLTINNNNTLIYGNKSSGKEDLLNTIIYNRTINNSPNDLNIYYIDTNIKTIKPFINYPQIDDICTFDDPEKINDLFETINKTINERKILLANYNSIEEYRKEKELSNISIIINNYDLFIDKFPTLIDTIHNQIKESLKYGINYILLISQDNLDNKFKELFDNKIALQIDNPKEYKKYFNKDINIRPDKNNGRGLIEIDNNIYEFQTAYIYLKNEIHTIINNTCNTLNERYKDYTKKYIPSIPKEITVNKLIDYVETLSKLPIGYDIETKQRYYYNFKQNKANIITYKDLGNNVSFLEALAILINKIPNLNTTIIDMKNIFNISTNNCIKNNFEQTFETIIKQKIEADTLYIITGIGTIKDKFSEELNKNIDEYILNNIDNNNLHYIFIDSNESLLKIKYKLWYDKIINPKYGIYLGDHIGSQEVLNFTNLNPYDTTISDNNEEILFINNNGKKQIIKKVIYQERKINNEQQNND